MCYNYYGDNMKKNIKLDEDKEKELEEDDDSNDAITIPLVVLSIIDLVFGKLLPLFNKKFCFVYLGLIISIILTFICFFYYKKNIYYFLLFAFVFISFIICIMSFFPSLLSAFFE